MTQQNEDVKKIAELNALFLTLDDGGKEGALTVLRSLRFAQSTTCTPRSEKQSKDSPANCTA